MLDGYCEQLMELDADVADGVQAWMVRQKEFQERIAKLEAENADLREQLRKAMT